MAAPGTGDAVQAALEGDRPLRFTISSSSMAPFLAAGDQVIVRAAPEGLRPGDLLLVRGERGWLVHRLIGESGEGATATFKLKGDNAPFADGAYAPSSIVGRVTGVRTARGERALDSAGLSAGNRAIVFLSRAQAGVYRDAARGARLWLILGLGRGIRLAARLTRLIAGLG